MNLNALLGDLSDRGVKVWAEKGQLRLRAPKGVLTPDLQEEIRRHKSELLQMLGQGEGSAVVERIMRGGALQLSFMQERLWFLAQMYPEAVAYNLPNAHRMSGPLDTGALRAALDAIVTRHESLRTTFHGHEDRAEQRIADRASIALRVVDLGEFEDPRSEADRIAREEASLPFDLQRGPLLRCLLLRQSPEDHLLMWTIHHIITDGWSSMIFLRELKALYEHLSGGVDAHLGDLPVQYVDFAHWERQRSESGALQEQIGFWSDQLGGRQPVLELPTDFPRPPVFSYRGAYHAFSLPKTLLTDLKRLAQSTGSTLFMTLLAAFKVFLHRHSGQAEICVGSPIARRDRREIEGVIGCFINSLPLLTEVSGELSFAQFLQRVRETCIGAFRNQDVPFEELIGIIDPVRDTSRTPLFQVMFILHVQDTRKVSSIDDVQLTPIEYHTTGTKVDLTLELKETDTGLEAFFEYSTDLFEPGTIARMAAHFRELLEGAVAAPETALSQLPLLPAAERAQLMVEWNATETAYPSELGVQELFAAQARRTPSAVAVSCQGTSLTYAELEARSNRLARYLRHRGIGSEMLVGIYLERSLDMLVALLGVLKAKAAYVPLDPSFPEERLGFMLEDARVSLLLSETALQSALPPTEAPVTYLDQEWESISEHGAEALSEPIAPDHLAYVIYTSGSTGKPKGVQIPHRALTNFVLSMAARPGLGSDDVLVAVTTLSFDIAALELYLPLAVGARVIIASRQQAADGEQLARCLAESRATVMQATPATWRLLLESGWSGQPGLKVLCGGEALPRDLAEQILAADMELWNLYGPTETTVWSAVERVESGSGAVPIGRPIANTRIHVLDRSLGLVPVGVTGELHIGGDGLARGYLNRPELTAEKFIANPFQPATRLYRTGDLARYHADGRLEVLGRIDTQVKVRGYRIELGEIETVLAAHPDVQEAVVVVREDVPGDKRIVAYVIPTDEAVNSAELRSHLQRSLPDYMVPSAYVTLQGYPLTPNGKVDRRALPAPEPSQPVEGHGRDAPRNATEQALCGIWSRVLGIDSVGIDDDFFDLGGHSLLAVRLVASIETELDRQLELADIFQGRTIASLAPLLGEGADQDRQPPLVPAQRDGDGPLSFAQQRLWFLDQLDPDLPTYNVSTAYRLVGPLSRDALQDALKAIVTRHESLRTRIKAHDGVPRQSTVEGFSLDLTLRDLSSVAEDERDAELDARITAEARCPFDLGRGPLIRSQLYRLSEEDHVLQLSVHHVVYDGWSHRVFMRELSDLYAAVVREEPPELPALPVQYADYAIWQRDYLQGAALEEMLSFWKEELAGYRPILELPTDFVRPPVQSYRGARHALIFPAELVVRLRALGQAEGATLFMSLMAGFQCLLQRYTHQEDMCIGAPVAGRTHLQTEPLIGLFINTVVLRGDVSGNPSFREMLERTRKALIRAYSHPDLPFEKLIEALQPARDQSIAPIFQVMLSLQEAQPVELTGLEVSPIPTDCGISRLDLWFELFDDGEAVSGWIEYSTDLFEPGTIARMAAHFRELLEGAVAAPGTALSQLPLLPAAERAQLMVEWNATETAYPSELGVQELFAAQARRTPSAVAVGCQGTSLTYAELEARSNRLARYLRHRGIGSEMLVGIYLERSLDMLVALLGVLKAKAAYVPLDPSFPEERLGFMLEDARVSLLLSETALQSALPPTEAPVTYLDQEWESISEHGAEALSEPIAPDHLAYVIYTSGSTGKPKGVQIPHRALTNFVLSMAARPGLGSDDVLVAVTTLSFDIAALELYLPLAVGARVIIASRQQAADGEQLARCLAESRATVMQATPATWRLLLESGWSGQPGLKVLCGGEALPRDLAEQILAADMELWNLYGPTETTVWSAVERVESGSGAVPIGRPIANTRIHVLDRSLGLVPVGVTGELHIGGDGLARGYLNRPELTAEKFIANPFQPATRLYRTGDLARYHADGRLEVLGRIDTQVKVRGYRIELGEIETVLAAHPDVQEAVVVVREDVPGDKRIVAYVIPTDEAVNSAELRSHLQRSLPDYMVPSAYVTLQGYPLTPNGKVDRRALPAPEPSQPVEGHGRDAPRNATEQALCGIWSRVLGIDSVGIDDDFFDLGGHSLLAVRLVASIETELDRQLELADIFQGRTIASLAPLLGEGADQDRQPPLVPAQRDGDGPLSFAQQRLWFLDQLDPDLPTYNVSTAYRLVGPLSRDALQDALKAIVTRHESLRTRIKAHDGVPRQSTVEGFSLDLTLRDLSSVAEDERDAELDARISAEARCPFDLGRGPLIRSQLYRLSEEDHVLQLSVHHVVYDGWSHRVFMRELSDLYAAVVREEPPELPALPVQYADYAIWQRDYLQGAALEEMLSFWKEELAGYRPILELPTDFVRPPVQSYRGARHALIFPAELVVRLRALGQAEGATLFMSLMAGFQCLLQRYTHQEDMCIGAPVAGRTHLQTEPLIGLFINTVVLRGDVSGNPSFREMLERTRKALIRAYSHPDLPFEKLIEALQPARDQSIAPIFQVMLSLQEAQPVELTGLEVSPIPTDCGISRLDLWFELFDDGEAVSGWIEYSTDLFEPGTIARMAAHFRELLEGAVAAPETALSQLPLLPAAERAQLMVEWNATETAYPSELGVQELFAAQARRTPSAVAVSCQGTSLTYAELEARSNRLARYLRHRGIGSEMLVGIYLERSLDMLVALLGVLKAKAAYVPLDPSFPEERLGFMLEDARVSLLLSETALQSALPPTEAPVTYLDQEWESISEHGAEALSEPIAPDHLAYVIYTSGSTGKPKGVQIPHRALTNFVLSMAARPGLGSDDVLVAVTTLSFDIAALELYLPLAVGARVIIASRQQAADGEQLARCLAESRATVMQATPATWRLLLESGWSGQPGLKVLCGGEALPRDLAEQILAADMELWNLYGPTETTVWSAVERVESGSGAVPIGRPIANTRIHVLDRSLGLVPVGVTGELHIGGDGLARGYLNRPELTAEKFIANPFQPATRLYRTGDLARYHADGRLEVLGRIDTQVKVRGYRIELGEIETVLAAHPDVQEAVVVVREDVPGDKRIVAYVIPTDEAVNSAELRSHLQRSLPDYMVPSAYVTLQGYPLTPNGKVDRRALPAPEPSQPAEGHGRDAPRNATEQALCGIWSRVLGIDSVGIDDDFFDLGGHSLLAVRLVASIEAELGLKVPLAAIFQCRTIATLGSHLDGEPGAERTSTCVVLREGGTKPPFFAGGSHPRYRDVARTMDGDRPVYRLDVYALQSERLVQGHKPLVRVEDIAAHFIDQIQRVQPRGPYCLGGGCEGGYVAYEMARQLQQQGQEIECLVLWLAPAPDSWQTPSLRYAAMRILREVFRMIRHGGVGKVSRQGLKALAQHEFIEYKIFKAIENYRPSSPYRGSMVLGRHFDPAHPELAEKSMGWKDHVTGDVVVHELPGEHGRWLEEYWAQFARLLDECLGARA